jgi:hypothetical protein
MAQLHSRTRLRPSCTARPAGRKDPLREPGRWSRRTEFEALDFFTVPCLPVASSRPCPTRWKSNFPLTLLPGVLRPTVSPGERPTATRMGKPSSVWSAARSARSVRTFARLWPDARRLSRCFRKAVVQSSVALAQSGSTKSELCGSHGKDERGFATRTPVRIDRLSSHVRTMPLVDCLPGAKAHPDFSAERRKARDERPTHAFTLIGITHEARDAHQRGPAGRMPDCHS